MTGMTNLLRGATYQLVSALDSCVCRIECCAVSSPRISSCEPTGWTGALTVESVFTERNHSIAIRPCFDYLSRDRSGGSSVIGYHLPQSVSVFVREFFRRSADQLVVAQPGANARRWERIVWRFHNTRDDVLQEHVCYGDLRLHERLKMLPLLRQVRECGCNARLKLRYGFSVITPANLAFASGEDKYLFGSEAPVLRRFPHSLSEFLVRKQQTPLNSGFCHIFPSI